MNVYVRALATALARAGVECDVYTRAEHRTQPAVVEVEPGFRVAARRRRSAARRSRSTSFPTLVEPFVDESMRRMLDARRRSTSCTATTGSRARSRTGSSTRSTSRWSRRSTRSPASRPKPASTTISEHRTRVEHEVIACADLMLASTDDERDAARVALRRAVADRIEVVPPGVDHTVFFPGDRDAARQAPRYRRAADAAVRRAHPTAEGRRPRDPLPGRARRPEGRARRRRRPERPRRPRRAGPAARARRRARRRRPRSTVVPPAAATIGSPTTTAPPTCASSRRGRSRSGWSRSRRPRAARRWSRPRSAVCARSSTTSTTGFLVDGRDPARLRRAGRDACSTTRDPRGRDGRDARRRARSGTRGA